MDDLNLDEEIDLGSLDDLDSGDDFNLDDDLDTGLDDDLNMNLGDDLDADLDSNDDLGSDLDLGDDLDADLDSNDDLGSDLDLGDDLDADLDSDLEADLDSNDDLNPAIEEEEKDIDFSGLETELGDEASVDTPEVAEIEDLDDSSLDDELASFSAEAKGSASSKPDTSPQVELDQSMQVPEQMLDAEGLAKNPDTTEPLELAEDSALDEELAPLPLDDDLEAEGAAHFEEEITDELEDSDSPFSLPTTDLEDEDDFAEPAELVEINSADNDFDLGDDLIEDEPSLEEEDFSFEEPEENESKMDVDLSEQAFDYGAPFEEAPSTSYQVTEEEQGGLMEKSLLFKLPHLLKVEVGHASLKGEDITNLTYGSIIELDLKTGDPVDILLGGEVIAKGEVIRINEDQLGVRITRINH